MRKSSPNGLTSGFKGSIERNKVGGEKSPPAQPPKFMQQISVTLVKFQALAMRAQISFPRNARVTVYGESHPESGWQAVVSFDVKGGVFTLDGVVIKERRAVITPSGHEITVAHPAAWHVASRVILQALADAWHADARAYCQAQDDAFLHATGQVHPD
jgi:hypothetical protein